MFCFVILFSRYFFAVLFVFIFMQLTWQMEMNARKRSINMVSSSVFCMFIRKEENLRLTVYKTEIVRAQLCAGYCTRWPPKVILGA